MQTKQLVKICALWLLVFGWYSAKATDDWTLEKNSAGVKVYTRFIEGWGMKEYKVHVQIKATLAQVEAVLRDGPNRSQWVHNAYDTKDVKVISKDEMYTYSAIDAPWPVSDRDNVVHWKYNKVSDKEIRIDMKSAPSMYPEQSGIVRIQRIQGHWRLIDLGNGYVEVIQQVVAEPGGSIPAWLANSSVVDTPFNSFLKLKVYVENKVSILTGN